MPSFYMEHQFTKFRDIAKTQPNLSASRRVYRIRKISYRGMASSESESEVLISLTQLKPHVQIFQATFPFLLPCAPPPPYTFLAKSLLLPRHLHQCLESADRIQLILFKNRNKLRMCQIYRVWIPRRACFS
jgi:hypothetical protein